MLVNALVISRIDFCISLLLGISSKLVKAMQRILNYAIKLVSGLKSKCGTKTLLMKHKWLPASIRPEHRIAVLTLKAIKMQDKFPLFSLLSLPATRSQALRSQYNYTLAPVRNRTSFGFRAFSSSAPRIWNSLPPAIKSDATTIGLDAMKNRIIEHLLTKL
jgi:hypothetical protein